MNLEKARKRATHQPPEWTNTFWFKGLKEFEDTQKGKPQLPNYTRVPHSHPDNAELERALTQLEDGSHTLVFSSGMAAITTTLDALLRPGDSLIAAEPCYTSTYHKLEQLKKIGIDVRYLNLHKLGAYSDRQLLTAVEALTDKTTKIFIGETPANPQVPVIFLAPLVFLAQKLGIILAIDNTFASPYNQRPLEWGCDISFESLTKYFDRGLFLGGSTSWREEIIQPKLRRWKEFRGLTFDMLIGSYYMTCGGTFSPPLAKRALANMETLEKEVRKQNLNALALAHLLEDMGFTTHYPGLISHPQNLISYFQMKMRDGTNGFGCVVSFDIGSLEAAFRFSEDMAKEIALAVSLGSANTTFQHPAVMTHSTIPRKKRLEMGITDGLIRVSCGIEDTDWILSLFEKKLKSFCCIR
ncbi:MAG: PLP-dependent transferase [Candidatus Sungiibacteriota bacterium]|uniref:PLP-dependent transferase n=1 Tax=Candidatus Sungiibacteriota bacterium TaxID=2750080 RepID=A0A7T5RKQ0_9BACT|nr:MAG: PLP-dependent transferase [Candidatus Sungbacteria bacterium]